MESSNFTSADAFLAGTRLWEPEAAGAKLHDEVAAWPQSRASGHCRTNGELATSHGVAGYSVSIKQDVDSPC